MVKLTNGITNIKEGENNLKNTVKRQAKKLAEENNINNATIEKCDICITPIENMTTKEIISNEQKWYNYNGRNVGSSYVQLYGLPERGQFEEWIQALKKELQEKKKDMLVFIIFEYKNSMTYEYQIMKHCIKEIIKLGIFSREKDIMPLIEERFLKKSATEEK